MKQTKQKVEHPNPDNFVQVDRNVTIADQPIKKKIGFFSSIMLVIGSSVGAGIFIKNWNILTNTQGALFYAILAWLIAIIGILALAFSLIEICSGSGKANSQGIIGWVREFNGKFLYRVSKNFMAYLHIPIIYVMMPIYMIMVSQQAFGYEMPWWGCGLITFAIAIYHIWFVGFFSKVANISNWVVSIIEFIPLLFASVSGFIVLAVNGMYDGASWFTPNPKDGSSVVTSFAQMSFVFGVLNSIPAVFFSFDGFYSAAGLQTEMHEPHKMPKSLTIGVTIVAIFEIFVSISLLVGSEDGSLFGLDPSSSPFPIILMQALMVCVFIGMLSVIAGSAVYAPRFYESLIYHDEMPFGKRFKNKLNTSKPVVGSVYATILFCIVFLITFGVGPSFWDIGGYSAMESINKVHVYGGDASQSAKAMANVLSFVDTYGNWNALFAFVCVSFAIFGAIKNRWTHKVKVTKSKIFLPSAIIAILVVGIGIVFVFINAFADFGISLNNFINNPNGFSQDPTINVNLNLIGSIIAILMLFAFVGIITIPAWISRKVEVKQLKHH